MKSLSSIIRPYPGLYIYTLPAGGPRLARITTCPQPTNVGPLSAWVGRSLLLVLLLLLVGRRAQAQKNWIGTTTNWNTSSNWSPAGTPTASDHVVISASATVQPVLSSPAVARTVQVQSGASLSITSGGSLTINGARSYVNGGSTTACYNNGTVNNEGKVFIGNTASVGDVGLINAGTFTNRTGGVITIDRSSGFGLFNAGGSFTNSGQITIGASAPVGSTGLLNGSAFTNKTGGVITIDRSSTYGLFNDNSTFTNEAQITLGAIAPIGATGLWSNYFFNNAGCGALLNIVANAVIFDPGGGITNSGTIIENADHQSQITENTGIVQNNNGSNFYVGSGPNQPLRLNTTTNCTASDGTITITGLHATTSYTLSYTVGSSVTTLSPNPTSNASGQLTIPNLGAGLYAITLGGSCVGLPLSLSATVAPAPDLTPILYARPSTVYGNAELTVVVDVINLCSVASTGPITLRITKDAKATLSFDGSLTALAGQSIQNSSWTLTDEPSYYVLTTSQPIAGGDKLSVGLSGQLNPAATSGVLTVSATLMGGSGAESRLNNNTDADKIDYFQQ